MEAMIEKVNVSLFGFEELNNCQILYTGYGNEDFHWNVIKKDTYFFFHKVFSRNAYWRGVQEI